MYTPLLDDSLNGSDKLFEYRLNDAYYEYDDDDDHSVDEEQEESDRIIFEFFRDFEKARFVELAIMLPDSWVNPFDVYD